MFLKFWLIAKYLGFVPLSIENRTRNVVQLTGAILFNLIRNITTVYLYWKRMCSGEIKPFYTAIQSATVLLHTGLVTIWIYTALTKLETWSKLFKLFNLLQDGNVCNIIFCVLGFICYFTLMVAEVFLFALNQPYWTSEVIFTWFNFHLSQCFNYILIFLLQQMVVSIKKSYQIFDQEFHRQIQIRTVCTLKEELRRRYMPRIRRYNILYDLINEFNEVFGLSFLTALGTIFVNILCGIAVFSQKLSDLEVLIHMATFITQVTISLVSLWNFTFFHLKTLYTDILLKLFLNSFQFLQASRPKSERLFLNFPVYRLF